MSVLISVLTRCVVDGGHSNNNNNESRDNADTNGTNSNNNSHTPLVQIHIDISDPTPPDVLKVYLIIAKSYVTISF